MFPKPSPRNAWEHALSLLPPRVEDFNAAINSCAKALQVQRGEMILGRMKEMSLQASLVTYNTFIAMYEKSAPRKALETFEELQLSSLQPDVFTYSSVISASGRAQLNALELFESMEKSEVQKNLICPSALERSPCSSSLGGYSALLSACERCSLAETQLKILAELRCSRIPPDVVAFNTVIRAQAKVGNTNRAGEMLRDMRQEELQPNVVSFNSFFTSFHKDSDVEELSEMLRSMQEHEIKPDVVTYSTLINAHEQHSRWEEALAMFREMDACRLRPNKVAFTAAVRACRGCSPELLDSFYAMAHVTLDLVAYNAFISACRSWTKALSLFGDLAASLQPDVLSFNALLRGLRGRWRLAAEAWQRLRRLGPDALSCESALGRLGPNVWAPRLLEQLERLGRAKLRETQCHAARSVARSKTLKESKIKLSLDFKRSK